MPKIWIVLFVLCLPLHSQQKEPLRFHGAYLGQPASDYIDCSTGKTLDKWMAGTKNRGREICQGAEGKLTKFGKITGGIMNPQQDEDRVFFKDGKVTSILLTMKRETFDNVLADMTSKLSRKPDDSSPNVLQNAFGAKWSFDKAVWVGNPGVLVGAKVDNSTIPPEAHGVEVMVTNATVNGPDPKRPSSLD